MQKCYSNEPEAKIAGQNQGKIRIIFPWFFIQSYGANAPRPGNAEAFPGLPRPDPPPSHTKFPPQASWPRARQPHPIPPPPHPPHKIVITQPNPPVPLSPTQSMLSLITLSTIHLPTPPTPFPTPKSQLSKETEVAPPNEADYPQAAMHRNPDSHADHPPHQLLHRNPQCPKRNVYQRPGNVLAGRPDTGPKRKRGRKRRENLKSNVSSGPKQSPHILQDRPKVTGETSRRWKR